MTGDDGAGGADRGAQRRGRDRRRGRRRGSNVHVRAFRRASPTSCRAKPSWSSSGDARRSPWFSARRAARQASPSSRSPPESGQTGRSCRRSRSSFARWIADHYLAPPALVIRAMLPPGLLERLDLVAERLPGDPPADLPAADRDILEQIDRGPRAVRDLVAPEGRAGLIRRLRSLEAARAARPGLDAVCRRRRTAVRALDSADRGRPIRGHDPGRGRAAAWPAARATAGGRTDRAGGDPGRRAGWSPCCRPVGASRPRSDRWSRPARTPRGGRPGAAAAAACNPAGRAARRASAWRRSDRGAGRRRVGGDRGHRRARCDPVAPRRRDRWREDRDLRRGDRSLPRPGPAGTRPRPGDRAGDADRRPPPGGSRGPGRRAPLGPRRGRARRRMAADPGRRRRHRRRDAPRGPRSARAMSASSSSTRSTREPTRATGPPASRRATRPSASRELAGAAAILGSATPAVDSIGRARAGTYRRIVLPARPSRQPSAGRGRGPSGGASRG